MMEKIKEIVLNRLVKRILPFYFFTFLPLNLYAQPEAIIRGDCTPDLSEDASTTRGVRRVLPTPTKTWDASRIYKQMVILVEFSDFSFNREDPREAYDKIFNEPGYNERDGAGCVADYFREQSGGLFNLQFDVYGPVKVSSKAQPYGKPTSDTRNYGNEVFREATKKVVEANPSVDFSQYDWNGDKYVDQVIYVYAGYAGNQGSSACYGYIWPNTASFSSVSAPGGIRISNYSSSAELWYSSSSKHSFGIGTICHEFTHCLGLPDIYPTSSIAGYSVVDEWDLMDGGNFTNYGWCPPNYTPLEKMLLGWLSPIVLTEPATIKNLKPSSEGGEVYCIKHSDSEWYLLENRQLRGWDYGLPGRGLVIYHVYYDGAVWAGNTVNNDRAKRRFELVHADNLDYDAWTVIVPSNKNPYQRSPRMGNIRLSTSPYPWTTDSTTFVNNELTDTSLPAAKMNYPNSSGSSLLGKPVTNIQMDDEGLISFDFMGGDPSDVENVPCSTFHVQRSTFDLSGRKVSPNRPGMYIIRYKDGTIKKKFVKP